jgi:hypothetical protein
VCSPKTILPSGSICTQATGVLISFGFLAIKRWIELSNQECCSIVVTSNRGAWLRGNGTTNSMSVAWLVNECVAVVVDVSCWSTSVSSKVPEICTFSRSFHKILSLVLTDETNTR